MASSSVTVSGDIVEKSEAVRGLVLGVGHLADLDVGTVAAGLQIYGLAVSSSAPRSRSLLGAASSSQGAFDAERVGLGRLGNRDAVLAVDEVGPVAARAHRHGLRRRAPHPSGSELMAAKSKSWGSWVIVSVDRAGRTRSSAEESPK